MELNQIPQNPNNWGNVADLLNENSGKIEAETAKLNNATTKFKGYFTTSTALSAKWPSPLVGDTAWVGETYPGVVYRCDVAGKWLATTDVPQSNTVNLSEYSKLSGNEEFTGIKKMARGLELKKGFVAYGQDTLLTGVGRYVAAYVSPTFGSRILSYDGVNYYDLVLGAYVNGKFSMTLKANGEVAFGHLKQTTGDDPEQVMSQDAVSKEFASVRSDLSYNKINPANVLSGKNIASTDVGSSYGIVDSLIYSITEKIPVDKTKTKLYNNLNFIIFFDATDTILSFGFNTVDIPVNAEYLVGQFNIDATNIYISFYDYGFYDYGIKESSLVIDKQGVVVNKNSQLLTTDYDSMSIVIGGDIGSVETPNFDDKLGILINNKTLNDLGVTRIKPYVGNKDENLEAYFWFTGTSQLLSDIKTNKDKFFKISWYIYSKNGIFPPISSEANRLGIIGKGLWIKATSIEQLSVDVVKVNIISPLSPLSVDASYVAIASILLNLTDDVKLGDYGIGGLSIGYYNSDIEAQKGVVKPDFYNAQFARQSDVYKKIEESEYGANGVVYNKVGYNQKMISSFLEKYRLKIVDKTNCLNVTFAGDSIIGSQLSDLSTVTGYATGDFAPNMSRTIMAQKFLEEFQFSDSDVAYRNLSHSDWIKTGFNIQNSSDSKTFNNIEVYKAQEGDSAQITVTGYKFFKLIWSEYLGLDSVCDVQISLNGGAFVSPSSLGILGIDTIFTNTDRMLMTAYKILTLEPSSTYVIKITPVSGYDNICLWGCEMWNSIRLNVVVQAFSGAIAGFNRNKLMDGYYSDEYKPDIIISDLFAINDYSFIHGADYTYSQYANDLQFIYDYIKNNGVPMLIIIPHKNYAEYDTYNIGRGILNRNSIPFIDFYRKMVLENITTSSVVNSVDGLHLNNFGQSLFFAELKKNMLYLKDYY